MEIELKFKLTAAKRKTIERILAERGVSPAAMAERYETTYFDTPDFALADAGWSLRVRRAANEFTQTLKSAGAGIARQEMEWRVKSSALDTSLLVASPLARVRGLGGLVPLFVTDIERTIYRVSPGRGVSLELALDRGAIRAGKARLAVHEMEIELKRGSSGDLYRFAIGLHAEQPLEIEAESKAARGYRLIGARQPTAHKGDLPSLNRDETIGAAVRTIVDSGFDHLLANIPALTADIEAVHQARVAIRRLRSALRLFGDHIDPRAAARFQAVLKRFGRILGDTRDWDVFVCETIPHAEADGLDPKWIGLLWDKANAARKRAHGAAAGMIARAEFTGFVLALAGWAEDMEPARSDAKYLRDTAPDMLARFERKALKRGRRIGDSSVEELHALRKTLKKLRYSVDYLAGLYPEKQVEKYLHACKGLQEALGRINDMATTDRLVAQLSKDDIAMAPAAGLLAEWTARRGAEELANLPKAWDRFEDARRFWAD